MKRILGLIVMSLLILSVAGGCSNNTRETIKSIDFNESIKNVGNAAKNMDSDGFGTKRWNKAFKISVAEDKQSMVIKVHSIRNSPASKKDQELINMLNQELGFGSSVNTKMEMTDISDGKQNETNDQVKVTWWVERGLTSSDGTWTYIYEKTN